MARRTTVVCDVCGVDRNVRTYRVGSPEGRLLKVDLCAKDAAPLTSLIELVEGREQATVARMEVTTEEDLERLRRTTKRAAKKAGGTNTPPRRR